MERMEHKSRNRLFSKLALVAIVVIGVVVGQSGVAEARFKGVHRFCTTSFRRMLCTKMMEGAADWTDAIKNGVSSTISLVKTMQNTTIEMVEEAFANKPENSRESAVAACLEDYDRIIEGLNDVLSAIAQNATQGITTDLESGLHLTDCLENFSDFNVPIPPLLNRMSMQLDWRIWNLQGVASFQYMG